MNLKRYLPYRTIKNKTIMLLMFAVLIAVTIITIITSTKVVFAVGGSDTDWYYSATTSSDFVIYTADELAGLAEIVNSGVDNFDGKTITLANDIDLSDYGVGFNNGHGWIPIGVYDSFCGTFDGAGNEISGLRIYRYTEDPEIIGVLDPSLHISGLFGYVSSGTIKNLGILDADISGLFQTGGIVGEIYDGVLEKSYVTGSISAYSHVGGLVGISNNTEIMDSYSSTNVSGAAMFVGGLVGGFSDGMISNSYSTGDVTGDSEVGGIAGSSKGSIINCHSSGNILGTHAFSGGIAGVVDGAIENSYFTGEITGNDSVGGIAGTLGSSGSVYRSYSLGNVNGIFNVGGIVGRLSSFEGVIASSYSKGKVSGDFRVGGIVGGQDGGDVKYSYSTSEVIGYGNLSEFGEFGDSGIGGISGMHYNIVGVDTFNSVALNPSVTASERVARVLGQKPYESFNIAPSLSNNYALSDMTTNGGVPFPTPSETYNVHNNMNGEDITASTALSASFWTDPANWRDEAWDTSIWDIQDGELPILRNVGGDQSGVPPFHIVPESPDEPPTEPPIEILYGDLNSDDVVDGADLILMLKYFSQPDIVIDLTTADVNGDSVVDGADLILFLKYFTQPEIILGSQEEGDE